MAQTIVPWICDEKIKPILILMEKFMLIMREDLKKLRHCTTEERFADMHAMFEWTKSLTESGHHVHSEPLAISGSLVGIAQTCPLVKMGMAIIEVRPVLDPVGFAPKPR